MCSMFILMTLVITMIGTVHGYYKLKGCFASEHYEIEELFTDLSNIDQIKFDLVTAGDVFSNLDSDQLIVKFYHSARESYLLEEMVGGMAIVDRVLYIEDQTPAFDLSSCQYTFVEILVPSDVTIQSSNEPLSVTGSVQVGYVGTYSLSNLGNVNINVNVGYIDFGLVNANSITATAGLGMIYADTLWSEDLANFEVNTGSIRTQSIMTENFVSTAYYGTSWNVDIQADQAFVHTVFGYASLLRPTHFTADTNQEVTVGSHYGKSIATYDQFYNVNFNVKSGKGKLDMKYDDSCKLEEQSSNSLSGTCSFQAMEPITTVTVTVDHGSSVFIQTKPDFACFQDNVDMPKYEIDDAAEILEKFGIA